MAEYTNDYLLNRQVKIFQPVDGYRASTDAVILSSLVQKVKKNDKILDVGSGTGAISLCLAARFQEIQPQITGIEIQPELAELSARSAEANGFPLSCTMLMPTSGKKSPPFRLAVSGTSSPTRPTATMICLRPIPEKLWPTISSSLTFPPGCVSASKCWLPKGCFTSSTVLKP